MMLPMFLLLAAAVFITQLVFCFYAKKLWIKLLPVSMGGACALICWLLYFFGSFSDIYGGDFAAFVYGIVMLAVTALAGMAWAIYGIVKYVQNRRNNFVM